MRWQDHAGAIILKTDEINWVEMGSPFGGGGMRLPTHPAISSETRVA